MDFRAGDRVSKLKKWQERAHKLIASARTLGKGSSTHDNQNRTAVNGSRNNNSNHAEMERGLRPQIEACLAEIDTELSVSGVPEALELSAIVQVSFFFTIAMEKAGWGRLGCDILDDIVEETLLVTQFFFHIFLFGTLLVVTARTKINVLL